MSDDKKIIDQLFREYTELVRCHAEIVALKGSLPYPFANSNVERRKEIKGQILDALEAQDGKIHTKPKDDWRPIEGEPDTSKAPWDGKRVLVFCPEGDQFSVDEYAVAYWCTDARVWYSRPPEIEIDPVKWMPLPGESNEERD